MSLLLLLALTFYSTTGWTGGDGAYSVDLGEGRILWLFGDTFTAPIVDGKRSSLAMIHNSFAITEGDQVTFYPHALHPDEPGSYYWPSAGALVGDKLYLFEKRIRDLPDGPPGLSFEWLGDDLLQIENWRDPPDQWRIARREPVQVHAGIACLAWNSDLYAYGLHDGAVVLARYQVTTGWGTGYWGGCRWEEDPSRAAPLFRGAGAEMSVFPYRGQLLAVYTEGGLGTRIVGRTAPEPQGPWSEPFELYRVTDGEGLLVYAGKAHSALSTPETLVLSYCRNIGALEAHRDRPEVYFPRFVEVKPRWEKNAPEH